VNRLDLGLRRLASTLQSVFHLTASDLGALSSAFFWPYLLLQPFIGWLFDRFGELEVLGVSMGVALIGGLVFALSDTIELAILGRLLTGLGTATPWLGIVLIARGHNFYKHSALMTGLGVLFGLCGALLSQTPLVFAVRESGFSLVMSSVTVIPAIVAVICGVLSVIQCRLTKRLRRAKSVPNLQPPPMVAHHPEPVATPVVPPSPVAATAPSMSSVSDHEQDPTTPSLGMPIAVDDEALDREAIRAPAVTRESTVALTTIHGDHSDSGVSPTDVSPVVGVKAADKVEEESSPLEKEELSTAQIACKAISSPFTISMVLYSLGVTAGLLGFSNLWATPFLVDVYHMDRAVASGYVSFYLLGWGIGGPLIGQFVDFLGGGVKGSLPILVVGPALNIVCFCLVVYGQMPEAAIAVLFSICGLCTTIQAVFSFTADAVTPAEARSTAVSIVNSGMILPGAVLQPLIGAIMDSVGGDRITQGATGGRVYPTDAYQLALLTVPICNVISLLSLLFAWRALCRPKA
jgi:MFS family permease